MGSEMGIRDSVTGAVIAAGEGIEGVTVGNSGGATVSGGATLSAGASISAEEPPQPVRRAQQMNATSEG